MFKPGIENPNDRGQNRLVRSEEIARKSRDEVQLDDSLRAFHLKAIKEAYIHPPEDLSVIVNPELVKKLSENLMKYIEELDSNFDKKVVGGPNLDEVFSSANNIALNLMRRVEVMSDSDEKKVAEMLLDEYYKVRILYGK